MRRAAKVDKNQSGIVSALRQAGCSVQDLSAIGKGCPDLAVGFRGANYFLEVKDGTLSPSKRQLTDDQVNWHALWRGHVRVVNSIDEALIVVGAVKHVS